MSSEQSGGAGKADQSASLFLSGPSGPLQQRSSGSSSLPERQNSTVSTDSASSQDSAWSRSSFLAIGVQRVIQARRSIKAMQEGVDSKKQAVSALGASAFAVGTEAFSALDQRLQLSEKVVAADQKLGLTERATAARQGLAEKAAAVDQRLGISERAASMRPELSQEALPADRDFTMFERFSLLAQDVADLTQKASEQRQKLVSNVMDLSQKASEQRHKLVTDLNVAALKKAANLGLARELGPAIDPKALCFYDAKRLPGTAGLVGLTIDDGPCHQGEPDKCMLKEVKELLAEFDAKATLFLCTDHVPPHDSDLIAFLSGGHEVANHCGADRPYSSESEQAFEAAFLESERVCEDLRRRASMTAAVNPTLHSAVSASISDCHSGIDGIDGASIAQRSLMVAVPAEGVASRLPGVEAASALEAPAAASTGEHLPANFSPPPRKVEAIDTAPSEHEREQRASSESTTSTLAVAEPVGVMLPPRVAHWFRAPHADASPQMQQVLKRHGFTNVLCDSFANDTLLTNPEVIADGLLSMIDSTGGSIVVIHVPERGFREHNFEALRLLLSGLREKGLRATSLTALNKAAWEGGFCIDTIATSAVEAATATDTTVATSVVARGSEGQGCVNLAEE